MINQETMWESISKERDTLEQELVQLDPTTLTTEGAIYIGGLLIGRHVEEAYLDTHFLNSNPALDMEEEREIFDDDRKFTADLHAILLKAKVGDFTGLKEYLEEKAEANESIANSRWGINRNMTHVAFVLRQINELIPPSGDGSVIKVPIPAWMEEPAPLRIQLEQLNQGGEN